jgi:Immunity protein 71/Immunity protein 72
MQDTELSQPYEAKLIPTKAERRKVFYHLKKISSYTAWNRILDYYKVWAEVFERSVSEAADKATAEQPAEINTQKLISVLKGLATCEKCVALLKQGNKSPFRYDGLLCFAVAQRPKDHWVEFLWRLDIGESRLNTESIPYWLEICDALSDLCGAWQEAGRNLLDPSDTYDPAPFAFDTYDREFYFGNKATIVKGEVSPSHHFPADLPEVPEPEDVVLVQNGQDVPYSGIYEPIKAPPKKGVLSLLEATPPVGPFEILGAMNYLHANSRATHIGEGREPIPTTWRLIWKDDRYTDGTIPAEESSYVFNEPRKKTTTVNIASASVVEAVIFANTGERAIKAGVWAVQEDLQARQTFAVGDTLPQHNNRDVTWVWTEA